MLATREGAGLLLLLVVVVTCHTATGNSECQRTRLYVENKENVKVTRAKREITVTPINTTAGLRITFSVADQKTAVFTRVTYRVLGDTPQRVLIRVVNTPDWDTASGTIFDNDVTVGKNKVMEFSPPAIGNRIRFAITPTAGTTDIHFVIVSEETCPYRTENGLDALRLQSLVNAGNVERTADRGDFFTAFRNQWMFVEYQRQDGQMALFNSVTCNLIGGTGQIGTRILTTSSSSSTRNSQNIAPGQSVTFTFSDQAVGTGIRFTVSTISAASITDFKLQVTHACVGQPESSTSTRETPSLLLGLMGKITLKPVDPTAVFKTSVVLAEGQTSNFTRVTYRVFGDTPRRVLISVVNFPDAGIATGTIFDDNVIVGKDKVMEFSPPAIGNRIRFAITPTAGTTDIQFVIVSVETCPY
ncbi:hypothetical protein BaRGS_00035462, partial [Batillaria attramentaria]